MATAATHHGFAMAKALATESLTTIKRFREM
jgi:hypothetical protein